MRSVAVAVLLALGVLLAFSANATVWANRTIFDSDEFVSTTTGVLNHPEVEQQLAVRVTDRIMERGDVQGRIQDALPEGLKLLAAPLTQAARELIERTALRIVQSDRMEAIFETALRTVHEQLIRILEDEGAVGFEGDSIVIDLLPVLEAVAEELGADRVGNLLADLDLPPDAGQIVLVEDAGNARAISQLARLHDRIMWVVVGLAVAAFAAAVLVSRDRRGTTRTVGYCLIIAGVLAAALLFPVRGIAASFAQNPTAAREAFNQLLQGYRDQSLVMILVGLLIAGIAALFGQTVLARALRSTVSRNAESRAGLREELRESATALRVGGLAIGALVLLIWPDPSARVYWTALILIGAYLVGLWIITSDTEWAQTSRERFGNGWRRVQGEQRTEGGWFARNSVTLRTLGVMVTLLLLLFWPGLTLGVVAALIAACLLYLAAIELLASRSESA